MPVGGPPYKAIPGLALWPLSLYAVGAGWYAGDAPPVPSALLFLYRTKARYANTMIATPPMPTPTPKPIDAPDERPLELGSGVEVVEGSGEGPTDVVSCGGGAVDEGSADVLLVGVEVLVELVLDVETASKVKLKY